MSDRSVSVVMPVLNGERFVAEAVASVRVQAWPDLELIAVDDGSTDGTPGVLEALVADPANRMRVVRTGNRGPAAARNHGLRLARGAFIAFIDADDLWPVGRLEAQMCRLAEQPGLQMVYGLVEISDCEGFEGASLRFPHGGLPVVMSALDSAVFRADVFARVGMLDEGLRHGEDTEWLMRAIDAGTRLTVINQVTLIYRQHDTNTTRDVAGVRLGMFQTLQRSLARRRSAGIATRQVPRLSDFLERDGPAR